ncbi:hypothetical protein C8R45DRAFT_923938 [Mycena sanguinolenta]|nr:hypothetical protein C8R45DRAFT_923938 [Mycena sanguinolenta]
MAISSDNLTPGPVQEQGGRDEAEEHKKKVTPKRRRSSTKEKKKKKRKAETKTGRPKAPDEESKREGEGHRTREHKASGTLSTSRQSHPSPDPGRSHSSKVDRKFNSAWVLVFEAEATLLGNLIYPDGDEEPPESSIRTSSSLFRLDALRLQSIFFLLSHNLELATRVDNHGSSSRGKNASIAYGCQLY